ncbi:hypothetical protein YC2023_062176 [Brassica napus]
MPIYQQFSCTASRANRLVAHVRFKIDVSDLKNKGGKPTIRVSNVGHALHVWLNGEYHGKIEKLQHLDVMFRELE